MRSSSSSSRARAGCTIAGVKVLLVDDNTAPFPVEPANGTTPIQCTPGDGGGAGTSLVKVNLFTNTGQVNFASGDDIDLFDVSPVCTGDSLRITWNVSGSLLLNAGSVPGFNFTLTVDGDPEVEFDAIPGAGYSGSLTSMQFSVSRSFWVIGLPAGTHHVVLNAAFQGATAATGAISANSSLVVEDWSLVE